MRLRGAQVPIVVVGNKSDLEVRRLVSRATSQARVELDWGHGYTETCALQPDSVLALFKKVLHQGQVRDPHKEYCFAALLSNSPLRVLL